MVESDLLHADSVEKGSWSRAKPGVFDWQPAVQPAARLIRPVWMAVCVFRGEGLMNWPAHQACSTLPLDHLSAK